MENQMNKPKYTLGQMLSIARLACAIVTAFVASYGFAHQIVIAEIIGLAGLVAVIVCSLVSNRGQGLEMLWGVIRQAAGAAAGIVVYFGWIPLEAANEILASTFALAAFVSSIRSNTPERIAKNWGEWETEPSNREQYLLDFNDTTNPTDETL